MPHVKKTPLSNEAEEAKERLAEKKNQMAKKQQKHAAEAERNKAVWMSEFSDE